MSAHTANLPRQGYTQVAEAPGRQQVASSSPYAGPTPHLMQQQTGMHASPRGSFQQRFPQMEQPTAGPGMPSQVPAGYLQAQIIRQRQAAATANWAMQQERQQTSTQRLGSAILRLLNYSEQLNSFSDSANLRAWKTFVDEFYIDPALYTQSLPIDHSMSYELPTPLLPAYFHRLHLEISKFNLTFHDAREYYLPSNKHVVECPKCTLCFYFPNATKVEILGKLKVVYAPGPPPNSLLKIERWEFTGETWDEWVCRVPPLPIKSQGGAPNQYVDDLKPGTEVESRQVKSDSDNDAHHSDADDHEDLFGRSPSDSVPPLSRPSSRAHARLEKTVDKQTTDLNIRERMVLPESGVTARHLRFLEISDVLGQISPLFSRQNPKKTLETLLASLPSSQDEDGLKKVQEPQAKSSATKRPAPEKSQNRREGPPNSSATATKFSDSSIFSGKAMQQQANQVLQKQAAQTLYQALPPPNLDFSEKNEQSTTGEQEDQEDGFHETDDLFDSPDLMDSTNGTSHELENQAFVKVEDSIDEIGQDLDIDLDLDLGLDVQEDHVSELDNDEMYSDLLSENSKRSGGDFNGNAKRLKSSTNASE